MSEEKRNKKQTNKKKTVKDVIKVVCHVKTLLKVTLHRCFSF